MARLDAAPYRIEPPRWRLSITPVAPNGAAGAFSGRIIPSSFRVELEEVGDDFGFVRVVRKVAAKMAAFPVNTAITGKAAF